MPENSRKLEPGWKNLIGDLFREQYVLNLVSYVKKEVAEGKIVYPPLPEIFNAFKITPLDQVKVVILGQDPYHGPGQAHGLSFSVKEGVKPPPSLKNIYKEIYTDLGIQKDMNYGCLLDWSRQGVFLLNSVLSVRQGEPGSHSRIGWQQFTDTVIKRMSDQKEHLVFMLWGNYARSKKGLIDPSRHLILEAAHPSPLAGGAFFGCRHFSRCNEYLEQHGLAPINW